MIYRGTLLVLTAFSLHTYASQSESKFEASRQMRLEMFKDLIPPLEASTCLRNTFSDSSVSRRNTPSYSLAPSAASCSSCGSPFLSSFSRKSDSCQSDGSAISSTSRGSLMHLLRNRSKSDTVRAPLAVFVISPMGDIVEEDITSATSSPIPDSKFNAQRISPATVREGMWSALTGSSQ